MAVGYLLFLQEQIKDIIILTSPFIGDLEPTQGMAGTPGWLVETDPPAHPSRPRVRFLKYGTVCVFITAVPAQERGSQSDWDP